MTIAHQASAATVVSRPSDHTTTSLQSLIHTPGLRVAHFLTKEMSRGDMGLRVAIFL